MTWTNLTGSDVAFEIVERRRPTQRVRGPYRLRVNAERELRIIGCGDSFEIRETTFTCRCDDESHEMTEAEWCK